MASELDTTARPSDARDFEKICLELDALEAIYLRRRRLLDGPENNAIRYIEERADDLASRGGLDAEGLIHWARDNSASVQRVTLKERLIYRLGYADFGAIGL